MKKQFLAVLVALSIGLTPSIQAMEAPAQTFQDKPALTQQQKKAYPVLKALLFAEVAAVGVLGSVLLYQFPLGFKYRQTGDFAKLYLTPRSSVSEGMSNVAEEGAVIMKVVEPRDPRVFMIGGSLLNLLALHKLPQFILTYIFASWNKIRSYRIAKVCLDYNINVGQYRSILIAAEQRKADGLIKAIDTLYPKRFGADWRNRMQTLFVKYEADASSLVKRGSFDKKLNDDERDFVRMIELGAAMANLYYKTQPSRKNAVDSAIKLYKELGILA